MSNILGNMPPVFGSGYRGVVPAPSAADVSAQNILRADGTWGATPGGAIPSQTGNAGKLLTTDGTNASWASSLNTFQFGDVTLGSSGPSVKGTLSARAPRQGLVFDGTFGATSTAKFSAGSAHTLHGWITPTTSDVYRAIFSNRTGGGSTNGVLISRAPSGAIAVYQANATPADVPSTGTAPINKTTAVTVVFDGSSVKIYLNGVLDTSTNVSGYPTGLFDLELGVDGAGGVQKWIGCLSGALIYNRALSASEVVALYEAGAPAGADYNSASNTAVNTTSFFNNSLNSFGSASATGFSATCNLTSSYACVSLSTGTRTGKKVRVSITLSATSANLFAWLHIGPYGPGDATGTAVALTAGTTNVIEFTVGTNYATSTTNTLCIGTLNGSSNGASFTVSNVGVYLLGALLAPDAAQAGGGLTWYDTSGNAANITLPASGVSWNVPTSGKIGAALTIFSGKTTVTNSDDGRVAPTGSVLVTNGNYGSTSTMGKLVLSGGGGNNSTQSGWYLGSQNTAGVGGPAPYLDIGLATTDTGTSYGTFTSVGRFFSNGNLFIGASPVDGGQKLQVSGTGYFSAGITIGGTSDVGTGGVLWQDAGSPYSTHLSGANLKFETGSNFARTTALTLDSSQVVTVNRGSLGIGTFAAQTAALATFYSQNSGGGNRSWSIGTSALVGADNQYGLVIRDVTGSINALQLAYDTGNATFAGTVTATVNKSAANYTTVTTYVAAGSTTTTVHTFANANTNRSWIVSTRQQGSASNTVIGFATTYGGTLVVYRIAQSNTTGGVLDMNFIASGLNLQLVLGSGFGSTTWDTTITPIQG